MADDLAAELAAFEAEIAQIPSEEPSSNDVAGASAPVAEKPAAAPYVSRDCVPGALGLIDLIVILFPIAVLLQIHPQFVPRQHIVHAHAQHPQQKPIPISQLRPGVIISAPVVHSADQMEGMRLRLLYQYIQSRLVESAPLYVPVNSTRSDRPPYRCLCRLIQSLLTMMRTPIPTFQNTISWCASSRKSCSRTICIALMLLLRAYCIQLAKRASEANSAAALASAAIAQANGVAVPSAGGVRDVHGTLTLLQ